MSSQYAKVKYALYNSRSIQSESDDDRGSERNITSKYVRRKIESARETKVVLSSRSFKKSLSSESYTQPLVSLHQMSRDGDFERLQNLLNNLSPEAGVLQVNKLDLNGRAPLHYSARYNHLCVTQLLLDKGANPNIIGECGLTPLHFAARYGYNKLSKYSGKPCSASSNDTCQTVICKLIEAGAMVNSQDDYGMTPLHYAAMRGNVIATSELLKSNKINTEISDKQEMTPLHCAANYNSPDVFKLLLKANANPEAFDENQSTPLHLAATTGSREIVLLLLDAYEINRKPENSAAYICGKLGFLVIAPSHNLHCCRSGLHFNVCFVQSCLTGLWYIEEKNICGNSALHLAVTKGHLDVVKVLLKKGANAKVLLDNYTQPLHLAAVSGNVDIVKCLIEHGAEVNCVNNFGETPLHKAAAFKANDVVDFLLKKGSEIESYDNCHFTPLLIAVAEGHVTTVEKLLAANATIDVVDNMDRNVVLWAAQENHPDVLMTLLEYANSNALVNRCDHYDNSPLHIAAIKGFASIAEILLNHGAEIDKKNEHEQTPLHLAAKFGHVNAAKLLIERSKCTVNSEDENASTPLHLAAMSGHYQMISVLLNSGANLNARNCYLWTPLDSAAAHGWKQCCQILLNAGCPVDPVDKTKTTPLHLAAHKGHKGVLKLLLKYGANIAQCDKNGKNCLDLAIDKGHEEVAMKILSDSNWEAVLRNESDKNKFCLHQTPLRRLIRHMPDVAEHVFDQCIKRNNFPDDHPKLELTFNYEFLDDMFACYKPHLYEGIERDDSSISSSATSLFTGSNIYSDKGNVKRKVKPYTEDKEVLKYNHPLMLMVTYGRVNLLSHPLCENLLMHKWKNYGRYVYYGNLLIFVLFIILLTSYVVTAIPPCPSETSDPNCCSIKNYTCQPYMGKCDRNIKQEFPRICRSFIYFLAVLHLLKEVYQVHQNGRKYLNVENMLEWACYLSALIFVADLTECSAQTGIRQVWQWELGSLSIFSAWMVLLMFISKFPFLGIYVVMFIQILSTFVKFSLVFFLFVVAFALAFFSVLQNQDPFETPAESIMKTSVMMIGEIEFDAIFNDPDNKVYFKGPAYVLFIFFLLFMAIIIMNMLIGLAVDDIKGVQEKAALKRLAMKVELVLTVERILPTVLLRKCIARYRTVKPNAWSSFPWYWKLFKIRHKLSTRLPKSPLEELEEKQNKLNKQLRDVQDSLCLVLKDLKNIQTSMDYKKTD